MSITLVHDERTRGQFFSWLTDRLTQTVAVDTETTGLNPWHDTLRMVQFGDRENAWCLPHPEARNEIETALSWPSIVKFIGHNSKFDAQFLHTHGYEEYLTDDTKIMLGLLDPTETSLKPSADRWIGAGASGSQAALKAEYKATHTNWATIPTDNPVYVQYAGMDAILTALLYDKLRPLVEERYADLYELELEVWRSIAEAERRGMLVDEEWATKGRDEHYEAAKVVAARWPDLNLLSTKQLADVLKSDGVPIPKTPKGNDSLDEAYLSTLDMPLARDTLEYRTHRKIGKTYFGAALDLRDEHGMVHTTIHPMGARTGRMSSAMPNLQNWPRGPKVRGVFVPRPGHVLVSADYEQIEYRIFASMADEPEMIAAFLRGEDMHAVTARLVYDDPTITKDDPRRAIAKNANFAELYGAGDDKFAATAGISLAAAKEFKRKYHEAFPLVKRFTEAMARYVRGNGHAVETAYGRRLPVDRDQVYAGTNYDIQGTAADVLKGSIVRLSSTQWLEYFVLPVHDELVFDVPEEEAPYLIKALPGLMEVPDKFAVPLTIDVKVQHRWGEEAA